MAVSSRGTAIVAPGAAASGASAGQLRVPSPPAITPVAREAVRTSRAKIVTQS